MSILFVLIAHGFFELLHLVVEAREHTIALDAAWYVAFLVLG